MGRVRSVRRERVENTGASYGNPIDSALVAVVFGSRMRARPAVTQSSASRVSQPALATVKTSIRAGGTFFQTKDDSWRWNPGGTRR